MGSDILNKMENEILIWEDKMTENKTGEIIIYQADDGQTRIDVRFEEETVWLTQAQLVELYHSSKANISEHIKHIFEEGELDENSTVRKFRTVQTEGFRQVGREQIFYNLDMIISLGYRVKSIVDIGKQKSSHRCRQNQP